MCILAMFCDLVVLCLSAIALYRYRTSVLKDILLKQGIVYFVVTLMSNSVPMVSDDAIQNVLGLMTVAINVLGLLGIKSQS